MTEDEYKQALADREAALTRIRDVQAEIAKLGFIPSDQAKYNQLLADRAKLLAQQQRTETAIRRAQGTPGQQAFGTNQGAADLLEQRRQQAVELSERSAVERRARQMELQQRFGVPLGGLIAKVEEAKQTHAGRALSGAATTAGATVGGLARQGFSGTIEQNRFDFEWKLLSREFAAAFKPLIELFTTGVNKVRKFMESLGETGQNAVMYGGLAMGGLGLLRGGTSLLGGLGAMTGLRGGIGGGRLGGLVGTAALAGGGAVLGGAIGGDGGSMLGMVAPLLLSRLMGGGRAAAGMDMAALARTSAIPTAASTGGGSWLRSAAGKIPGWGKAALVVGGAAYSAMPSTPGSTAEFAARHPESAAELIRMQRDGGTEALYKEYERIRKARGTFSAITSWGGARFGYAGHERDRLEELERLLSLQGVDISTGKGKRRTVTPAEFGLHDAAELYDAGMIANLNKGAMEYEEGGGGQAANLEPVKADGEGLKRFGPEMSAKIQEMVRQLENISKNTEQRPDVR